MRANFDASGDRGHVELFVPFAVAALSRLGCAADSITVGREIALAFGLRLPAGVVTSILRRAVKQHMVVRTQERFECTEGAHQKTATVWKQQSDATRRQKALLGAAMADPRIARLRDEGADIEALLLGYIEKHAVPLLSRIIARPTSVPNGPQKPGGDSPDFAIASFISDALASDPTITSYIEDLVKGSMLSSAVYLSESGPLDRRFEKTVLYLDTPLLLKAIGHEGAAAQEATLELVSAARSNGATIAVFDHSVKEARNVLGAAEQAIRNTRTPDSVRGVLAHYFELRARPADLLTAIARLEGDIRAAGVQIVSPPAYNSRLTVDESGLEKALVEGVRYPRPAAARYDMKSVAAVHALRSGRDVDQIERTRAMLVTNNDALVAVSARYFKEHERTSLPPAVLDHDLATRLWLKSPTAAPNLPRTQILADSLVLLDPGEALWRRYLDEIDALSARGDVSADEVIELRFSYEAHRALVVETGNNPDRVDADVIDATLRRIREAAKDEERMLTALAAQEASSAHARAALAGLAAGELAADLEGERGRRLAAEQALATLRSQLVLRRDLIRSRARKRAHLAISVLVWFVVAVCLAAFAVTTFVDMALLPNWVGLAVKVVSAVVIVTGTITQTVGGSVRTFVEQAEAPLASWLERRMSSTGAGFDAPEGVG
ncbi:hypothetical protein [Cellulomonas dongxiuzhuiae]|uniref:hypothetical protein n=1 Tax=Cellulomonas dongxiuzhuiae TaxID=2819979 RepID=UPI001AAEAACB|nr:hypothetical protein [Cellulomonas dongxiuzhuiae]MBO3089957.1 hypothetical protein [Cellulomonas dongxiuzhuiae]MBO3090114.1 hypothetical protein [Cellulomonas dongxiuzhuiae]